MWACSITFSSSLPPLNWQHTHSITWSSNKLKKHCMSQINATEMKKFIHNSNPCLVKNEERGKWEQKNSILYATITKLLQPLRNYRVRQVNRKKIKFSRWELKIEAFVPDIELGRRGIACRSNEGSLRSVKGTMKP